MAYKCQFFLLNALLLLQYICNAFIIPHDPESHNTDNETFAKHEERRQSWLEAFDDNLGKYRNFYANLLQEDNKDFAVEIQELYNVISSALDESNIRERHEMLLYTIWLVENTKDLEEFLLAKGITNIL